MIYSTSQKYKPESKFTTDFEISPDYGNPDKLEFWISNPDESCSIFLGIEEIEKMAESLNNWLKKKNEERCRGYCNKCEKEVQMVNHRCVACAVRETRQEMAAWQALTVEEKLLDVHK